MLLLAAPMRRIHLDVAQAAKLQLKSLQRFDGLVWFCIIVLVGTGLLQMSSHPNYQGFLEIGNRWSTTILVKHLLFLVMVLFSAYLAWGLTPKLERLTLLNTHKGEQIREQVSSYNEESILTLTRKINLLLTINLIFGICVLALTALARVS
jgi:putative copper export protein